MPSALGGWFFIYIHPMNAVCLNGIIYPAEDPLLLATNKSFRYGDGLFETMRVHQGAIPLFDYHVDRLISGFEIMGYELSNSFNKQVIHGQILDLCNVNNCMASARVRWTAYGGDGGPFDQNDIINNLIEATPITSIASELPAKGLHCGIFEKVAKGRDQLSNLKSANYLMSVVAARASQKLGWEDAFIINDEYRIADSIIGNVFIVKDNNVITPPLSEGPISGVMRRWILENFLVHNYILTEAPIAIPDLLAADEIFLTNAVLGVRWVEQIAGSHREYGNLVTGKIYKEIVTSIGS